MRKYSVFSLLPLLFLVNCQKERNIDFLITKEGIGKLHKTSLYRDLDIIFEDDSIVRDTSKVNLGTLESKILVYEKGGEHLLTLTPSKDSIPTIDNIRIYDPRFETEKGVNINSTFKDIKDTYQIKKIITSINNVVILLKDSDIYFTIGKEELPPNLRYTSNTSIEAVQIPDTAKIKYMMVGWD